eukprot:3968371-Pyramimonas_sp.AAC.1
MDYLSQNGLSQNGYGGGGGGGDGGMEEEGWRMEEVMLGQPRGEETRKSETGTRHPSDMDLSTWRKELPTL